MGTGPPTSPRSISRSRIGSGPRKASPEARISTVGPGPRARSESEKSGGTGRFGSGYSSAIELGGGERLLGGELVKCARAACGGQRLLRRQRSERAVGGRSVWLFRRAASRWRNGRQVLECVYVVSPGGWAMPGHADLRLGVEYSSRATFGFKGSTTGSRSSAEPASSRCRRRCQPSTARRPGPGPAAEADDCALAAGLRPTLTSPARYLAHRLEQQEGGRRFAPQASPPYVQKPSRNGVVAPTACQSKTALLSAGTGNSAYSRSPAAWRE